MERWAVRWLRIANKNQLATLGMDMEHRRHSTSGFQVFLVCDLRGGANEEALRVGARHPGEHV